MSKLTTPTYQRQIADVTRDIRIQTGQFLRTAIEIGRLLFEAKAMVEPGCWSKYIEEELPFSHSWANNYMKLYKEYGSDQTSLFGDSQAFMNLRPTQALELLALPAEDREEFVQTHEVEDMSTRQLRQAVQNQLEEERRRHAETQGDLESAEAQLRDAEQSVIDLQKQLDTVKSSESARQKQIDRLTAALADANAETEAAKKGKANAIKQLDQNLDKMEKAKAAEAKAKADLKKARENPDVTESIMEQLRKETEAAVAQQATAEAQKALAAAEARAKEAEEKLEAAQKRLKMANPDIMEYNTLSQKLMADYNVMDGLRKKITVHDKEAGEKLRQFQQKMVSMFVDALEGIS